MLFRSDIKFKTTVGPHKIGVTFRRQSFAESDDQVQQFAPGGGQDRSYRVNGFQLLGPFDVSGLSTTPAREKILTCHPDKNKNKTAEQCAKEIFGSLAKRAYRRPVTDQDITELMAYYPIQVEKTLDRYEALVAALGEARVRGMLDAEEQSILDEFLVHGRAVRAERARAVGAGELPNFIDMIRGWGGITLYTQDARSGVPAERTGDDVDFDPKPVAAKDLKPLAAKLAQDLTTGYDFAIGFTADWDTLATSDTVRGLAADAMRNAAYAIAQIANTAKRGAIAEGLHIVKVAQAARPGVVVQKGVLTVSYAPQGGPSARPSSLAIARALEAAL